MSKTKEPHNDVALRILNAADTLMATEGLQNLSTHKIAKAAGVSVGTIYLYFKDKETLLNELIYYLFESFQQTVLQTYDKNLPLVEQYERLWRANWQFMSDRPNLVKNMYQYESLPGYQAIVKNCLNQEFVVWNAFVKQGQEQGVIARLCPNVLFVMSMKVAWHLMYMQLITEIPHSEATLNEVMRRTWKAISI